MGERWPVTAGDGHTFELLVEVPSQPDVALFFVPAALSVVRDRSPAIPFYVGGHSLGGQLAMLHVADARPEITGMVFVACAIPYYQNWSGRRRTWIRLATVVVPIWGFVLGCVPGDRFGFGGKEARTLMRDWAHNARTARYELTGSDVDYESALAELPVDLVTVNIDGDDMAPPNAVDFIFQKLPSAHGVRVEAKLAESRPGAHVRWARDADDVVRAVAGWIGERPASTVHRSLKMRSRSERGEA